MGSLRPKTAQVNSIQNRSSKNVQSLDFKDRSTYQRAQKLHQSDHSKTKVIWEALGAYISKTLKYGRGVWIPKFGQFSFTGMDVDLSGSTNPSTRDKQDRFPVFLVGKDFVNAIPMKCGIAGGMTSDIFDANGQGQNGVIREYGNKGLSGIIPKVKINYFEVATLTDGVATKDECRHYIESVFKQFSDQARKGIPVQHGIPSIGHLTIKNGIAGVVFEQSLINECRGHTAKQFQNLFSRNNWMNERLYQPNLTNYGDQSIDFNGFSNLKVSDNAKEWLKSNLDIEFVKAYNPSTLQSPEVNKSRRREVQAHTSLQNRQNVSRKAMFAQQNQSTCLVNKKRTMSAYSEVRSRHSQSISRRSSFVNSTISRVPELAPFQLMNLANEIHNYRSLICDKIMNGSMSMSLRDILSSSKIQQIMGSVGYRINIGELKALLKELGFKFNGPSCSLQQLLQKVKEYINPEMCYYPRNEYQSQEQKLVSREAPPEHAHLLGIKKKEGVHTVVDIIKELFYSTGLTLYQIFRQGNNSNTLDFGAFQKLVGKYSNNLLSEQDVKNVFVKVALTGNREQLTYKDFELGFKIEVPQIGSLQSEVKIIQKVREWMFKRSFPTSSAYDRLIRSCDRFSQKTMRLVDFHKAVIINQIGLTAPEIDFLFSSLAGNSSELDIDHWCSKIYDDVQNPLQLIREVVFSQQLNSDDLLFQMKLKIWDDALDQPKFLRAIRCLDPSFSESQGKTLFDKLKNQDNKVEIQTFLNNVTGSVQETVDFRNKMFKLLYNEIYLNGKQQMLSRELENLDTKCSGQVNPDQLESVLKKVTGGNNSRFSSEEIQKFVRQLQKDSQFKIAYNEFMDRICALGNKDHNPFKSVIQRLAFFLESNKVSISNLIKRLGTNEGGQVTINKFTDFLKQKIEKRKSQVELFEFAEQVDIDKDGYIGEEDLKTCLQNMNSTTFFEYNGSSRSQAPSLTKSQFNDHQNLMFNTCKQIIKALATKRKSPVSLFKSIDTQNVGMINLGQFTKGINSIANVSVPICEKLFNVMDTNRIKMIDIERFDKILKVQTIQQLPKADAIEDNFNWQESIIESIKAWVGTAKVSALEAFSSFDQDFNGLISKDDMKKSLVIYLGAKPEEITDIRLDRLFRLLSFYKTSDIQPSDFQRLLKDENPYMTASTGNTQTSFSKSMGGKLLGQSTQNWKFAAIQQIGLLISKKYSSIKESFIDASKKEDIVNFSKFVEFVEKHNALNGFNMTENLLQKIFAEIDPHKKTYLNLKDWQSTFQSFNHKDHLMVELKNFLQCQFINCSSAYSFFQSFGQSQTISLSTFAKAVNSMIVSRVLSVIEVKELFKTIAKGNERFGENEFNREFSNIDFNGKQQIQPLSQRIMRSNSDYQKGNVTASNWESDVIDKLKRLIKSSGKSIDSIFSQIDTNNSGDINSEEFHKAMKLISLGLTDQEIQRILQRVDANHDGSLSYQEFVAKFRDDPDFDQRMFKRANNRLAHMKENMILYMTSAIDAFRNFDQQQTGKLTYLDFDKLVRELCRLSNEKVPCYTVIKDLFDAVDLRKDSLIDIHEWNVAFGGVETNDPKISIRATDLQYWENSSEAAKISTCIARNRKMLQVAFKEHSTHSDHQGEAKYITFPQAKLAMENMLTSNFTQPISDDKLKCLLRVGQVVQKIGKYPEMAIYDFNKMLNVYRDRHFGPQFK